MEAHADARKELDGVDRSSSGPTFEKPSNRVEGGMPPSRSVEREVEWKEGGEGNARPEEVAEWIGGAPRGGWRSG
jgi:hypothetical protein